MEGVQISPNNCVYVKTASADQSVTVAFVQHFDDKLDVEVGRAIGHEISRSSRSVNTAPIATWSMDIPSSFREMKIPIDADRFIGFVTLSKSTTFLSHVTATQTTGVHRIYTAAC